MHDLKLVHEVPGRLRFRLPLLGEAALDTSWLEAWLEVLAVVKMVRTNRPARSLVVEYEGGETGKEAVIQRLAAFSIDQQPGKFPVEDREAEIAPMVTTAMTIAALPFLTKPMRTLLTFVNVGSTLVKGADTLINQGVKMEVLDALAASPRFMVLRRVVLQTDAGILQYDPEAVKSASEGDDEMLRYLAGGILEGKNALSRPERLVAGDELISVTVGVDVYHFELLEERLYE